MFDLLVRPSGSSGGHPGQSSLAVRSNEIPTLPNPNQRPPNLSQREACHPCGKIWGNELVVPPPEAPSRALCRFATGPTNWGSDGPGETVDRVTFVTDGAPLTCYNSRVAERGPSMEWTVPTINLQRCDRCGQCVETCPTGAVEMRAKGPVIVRPDDCTYCTDCEAICPHGAIRCPYEIVWEGETG